MANVFVEPFPKAHAGPIEAYVLEMANGVRMDLVKYKTQEGAIQSAKAAGHKPCVARVRHTDKGNPDHWRPAD